MSKEFNFGTIISSLWKAGEGKFGRFGLVYLFWKVWFGFGEKKIGQEKVLVNNKFDPKKFVTKTSIATFEKNLSIPR